ncbi:MAG: aminotransferase class V-fold PLP-dependent enzyme [Clostridiaceae bacterium]|nr:aminotransferase class V-fold PLP-dependent enzyme [Clostridiaceae bacterium]
MSKLPLVEGVLRYIKEDNIALSMPGHKAGLGFKETSIGQELYENFIKCDITEVDGVDNLHLPQGIIREAQELLREYYKSKKAYFLVNGSTSGNLVMIFSCLNEGDKVLVERNCHRSILNAIILRKLRPVFIKNKIHPEYDAPMSIDIEHQLHTISLNTDAKGIIITYPNYYGICTNLELIIRECKKYNIKVLVDSAHGAHFGVHNLLPESAVKLGADLVVMSAHKTLPTLNQGSFLHVNDESLIEKVDFYVSAFLSTSPSYMIMCSMDYARYYLQEFGGQAYFNLLFCSSKYRTLINEILHVHVLDKEDMESIDLTRYVINIEKGYSAELVYEYLKSKKIQPEMCDGRNIVLIFSPFNKEEDFNMLYEAMKSCPIETMKEEYCEIILNEIPNLIFQPYEVMAKNKVWIRVEDSIGKVCAGAVVPYPPGVPLISLGEKVEENLVNVVKYYVEKGNTVLGIKNSKILVLEDEHEKGITYNV